MCCGGGGGPPPAAVAAPDYAGAAQATAAGNLEAARVAAKANRVSQYGPNGSIVYENNVNGDQDQWKATTTLSDEQKALLDSQNRISQGLAGVGEQGLGYVKNALDKPFDTSLLPKQQIEAGQTAQDAIMARLQPINDRNQAALDNRLVNQGINIGSEAWKNAQDDFQRGQNDQYIQAGLQGIGVGQQARQQGIQEQSFLRNEPLNMLNAVRTGAQVTNPSFSNVPQQATTAGPDMLGAAQAGFNSQMQQYNAGLNQQNAAAQRQSNMMGGLMQLGGQLLPYFI